MYILILLTWMNTNLSSDYDQKIIEVNTKEDCERVGKELLKATAKYKVPFRRSMYRQYNCIFKGIKR